MPQRQQELSALEIMGRDLIVDVPGKDPTKYGIDPHQYRLNSVIRVLHARLSEVEHSLETTVAAAAAAASSAAANFIVDTRANRLLSYPPASTPALTLFFESDTKVFYQNQYVGALLAWVYVAGMQRDILASLPTLTADDAGYLYLVTTGTGPTDYYHVVRWTGSAWEPGPGERMGGYYSLYTKAPTDLGWQLADGTPTAFLDIIAGGLVETPITPPACNLVEPDGVYPKFGSLYIGAINAAIAPGVTSANFTASGVPPTAVTAVNAAAQPKHLVLLPYFRR
jgi:hypothetical protein